MSYSYVMLTDSVRKGTILRYSDATRWERYNYGTTQWEPSLLMLDYFDSESNYFELYKEITEQEMQTELAVYADRWKMTWNAARKLCDKFYPDIPSPIKGMNYKDYVVWLTDFAQNQFDRVLYALSGMPKVDNWQKYLKKYGITDKRLIESLEIYHTDSPLFSLESYYDTYHARFRELECLMTRGDLENPNLISHYYTVLKNGFTPMERYTAMTP